MKKLLLIYGLIYASSSLEACRNTINNNTNTTYKIAEITQQNKDLKRQLYLPNEYLNDEQKAHTLKPGEEVSFGGHYLPTFAVFKKYPDDKWHSLVVVKQNECGPRGPENKYLLITDVLKCQLPNDYNPVYTFVRRKLPQEIVDVSKNVSEQKAVGNPYQEIQNILDDATEKIMDEVSKILDQCNISQTKPEVISAPAAATSTGSDAATTGKTQPQEEKKESLPQNELPNLPENELPDDDGKTCAACAA